MHKSFQLTLTLADTNYNLRTLVSAVDADALASVCELQIQSDPGNGAAVILVGDSGLSATRYGKDLRANDSALYRSSKNSIYTGDYYLRCNLAGKKINVDLESI